MKVSVAIPTYNAEAYIAEAVKSVLGQTFGEFELLVVDDHSTDATLEAVRSIVDRRIRVVRNDQRLGLPGNWNRCLSLAQGELISLFHQDDVMLPQNLEQKVKLLSLDSSVSFVHSSAELLVEASAPTPTVDWIEGASADFTSEGHLYFYKLLFRGNVICAPTVMARRQALLALGGFDEELSFTSDYEMWMKLCLEGRVAFISQPLIRYRWHAKNTSHEFRFERGVDEALVASRHAIKHFLKKTTHPEEAGILLESAQAIARHKRWSAELERAKIWTEEKSAHWERTATEQKKQKKQLEQAKSWLENEVKNWQKTAGDQEKMILEQKAWIHELETGKNWLAEQNELWRKMTEEKQSRLEAKIQFMEKRFTILWGVLLTSLIVLNPAVLLLVGWLLGFFK